MKKYHIKDADGSEYEVEEINDVEETMPELEEEPEVHDEALSEDEIAALRRLAAVADKLVALVSEPEPAEEESVEEPVDEEFDEEEEEEVIDTCGNMERQAHDSKGSIGQLEKKGNKIDDSLTDDVAIAWAKRYGGNK